MKRISDFDRFMHEVVNYGGIPMRRGDVYKHACKARPDFDARRDGMFGPDYTAFAKKAIAAEPWTLAEFEALEAGDMRIPARLQEARHAA